MISGNDIRRISGYLPIDHCDECVGYVEPKPGQTFMGIPYGWHAGNSTPYIEVVKNNKVIRSVNCSDIAEIDFED